MFLDCGISFQNQFGQDQRLATLCLRSLADFFLATDTMTRLNTFYVLNDLVQVRTALGLPFFDMSPTRREILAFD